jgi:hypothetical protein
MTDRAEAARQMLVELSERAQSRLVDWEWNREDIYAERLSRLERHSVRGASAETGSAEGGGRAGFAEDD